jgi:membrane-anchored glycerophosphoryl diester phosphodiesterase (GDPDase)
MATFVFSLLSFVISLYALFFVQYTDLSGILSDNTKLVSTLSVIILVLFLTGIFTGFPVTFFYMWLLSRLSGEKYSLKSVISSATEGKVKITPKPTSGLKEAEAKEVAKPKLSAKERAEARRKRRNR